MFKLGVCASLAAIAYFSYVIVHQRLAPPDPLEASGRAADEVSKKLRDMEVDQESNSVGKKSTNVSPIVEYDTFVTQHDLNRNYERYAGKKLLIYAYVVKLGIDEIGRPYAITGYARRFKDTEYLIAYFKDPDDLAATFNGSDIRFVGECTGRMTSGLVVLTSCQIRPSPLAKPR